jgi:hypothetical protein
VFAELREFRFADCKSHRPFRLSRLAQLHASPRPRRTE